MTEVQKDAKRLFTPSERMIIWQDKDRLCDGCKTECDIDEFEAHHKILHSHGGPTDSSNVQMLCKPCHQFAHRSLPDSVHSTLDGLKPRKWQTNCLAAVRPIQHACVVATPAAGKTFLGGQWLAEFLHGVKNDVSKRGVFVLVVSPSKNVRKGWQLDLSVKFGIQMTDKWNGGKIARDYVGASICYAGINKDILQRLRWEKADKHVVVILDEIHHGSDKNEWGAGATDLCELADRSLLLTGTPFRTDGQVISALNYDAMGRVIPDYVYEYHEAVADGVCRTVEFDYRDGIAEYMLDDKLVSARISDFDSKSSGKFSSTLYDRGSAHLQDLIKSTIDRLEDVRRNKPDAAALFVCKPANGSNMQNNESEEKELARVEIVSDKIYEMTGERPVVVVSDNDSAQETLAGFKNSAAKYLVAINMVSEGVNIPRLQGACLLRHISDSEMLFRQLFGPGRLGRQTPRPAPEEAAFVVLSQFPSHVEYATRVYSEAQAGLRERQEREAKADAEAPTVSDKVFIPISATSEDGILIHSESVYGQNQKGALMDARSALEKKLRRDVPIDFVAAASDHFTGEDQYAVKAPAIDLQALEESKRKAITKQINIACARHKIQHKDAWKQLNQSFGVHRIEDSLEKHGVSILDIYLQRAAVFISTGAVQ